MNARKIIGGLALAAGLCGCGSRGFKMNACQTYQGRQSIDQVATYFVFDSFPKELRNSHAEYYIEGDEDLRHQLKIGEKYCFTYTEKSNGDQVSLGNIKPDTSRPVEQASQ